MRCAEEGYSGSTAVAREASGGARAAGTWDMWICAVRSHGDGVVERGAGIGEGARGRRGVPGGSGSHSWIDPDGDI